MCVWRTATSVFRPNVENTCVDFHFGLGWSDLNGRRGGSLEVIDDRIVIERATIWQGRPLWHSSNRPTSAIRRHHRASSLATVNA
jgi:hypothetical protein